jgi:hypothetical protein
MERNIEKELSLMQSRMNRLSMSDSQRLVALAAMRNGFVLVDACERLGQVVTQLGSSFFAKPGLAR